MKGYRVLAVLFALVLTACSGGGGQAPDFTPAVVDLKITPSTATVAASQMVEFSATATLTNPPGVAGTRIESKTKANWSVDDASFATVDANGVVTGLKPTAPGQFIKVTASKGGKSATALLSITSSPLDTLTVDPATAGVEIGGKVTFKAFGTFVPVGGAAPTTGQVAANWSSSDAAIATIDAVTGEATGLAIGTVTITAELQGKTATATLQVTGQVVGISVEPATASVRVGETKQNLFTAKGACKTNSEPNGPTVVCPVSGVSWGVSNDNAEIADPTKSTVTGKKVGTATVTATRGAFSAAAQLTITDPRITALVIDPATAAVEVGGAIEFKAIGTFEGGGTGRVTATWTSSDPTVATIDPATGVATGVGLGSNITITAAVQDQTATAKLTVTGKLVQLTITPDVATIGLGQKDKSVFTVTGVCKNGLADDAPTSACPVSNVFWTVDNDNASIDSATGAVSGNKIGASTVTATKGALSDTAILNIGAPVLESVVIVREPVPNPVTAADALIADLVPVNTSTRYHALGIYSNDPVPKELNLQDADIAWNSSVTTVATATTGNRVTTVTVLPTALVGQTSVIKVTAGGLSASLLLTVSNAVVLLSVEDIVFAPGPSIPLGQTATAIARGRYNNGQLTPLANNQIDWTSSDTAIATIDAAGVITANLTTPGSVTIKAALKAGTEATVVGDNRFATAEFAVTDAVCIAPLEAPAATITPGPVGGALGPLSCVLNLTCSYETPDLVIDNNRDTFGQINITVGLLASLSFSVESPTIREGGNPAGFIISNPAGPLLSALALGQQIKVETLLNGAPVESTGPSDLLQLDLLGSRLIGGFPVQQGLVSVPTTAGNSYNGLRVTFNGGLLGALSGVRVYQACAIAKPPVADVPD